MKLLRKIAFLYFLYFCFVFSVGLTQAAALSDVPSSHEHSVAIRFLFDKGVMKGYANGEFRPEQLITRAEALKVILENSGVPKAQSWDSLPFSDITNESWETPYVIAAYKKGIITQNDGKFYPTRTIVTAEFIKILLLANGFTQSNWQGKQLFNDVPSDAWFAPYMNYAGHAGIVSKDEKNNLYPSREPTRANVAEMLYLLTIIQNGNKTDFLIQQAQLQMDHIGIYMAANKLEAAKRASELGVDMTQQAYKMKPDDSIVLGEAKLAKAYHFMLMSFIAASQNGGDKAVDLAKQAITKANEAGEVHPALQAEAKQIKEKATEILGKVGSL